MAVAVIASRNIVLEKKRCLLNAILFAINEAIFNCGILLNCEDKRNHRCVNDTFVFSFFALSYLMLVTCLPSGSLIKYL